MATKHPKPRNTIRSEIKQQKLKALQDRSIAIQRAMFQADNAWTRAEMRYGKNSEPALGAKKLLDLLAAALKRNVNEQRALGV